MQILLRILVRYSYSLYFCLLLFISLFILYNNNIYLQSSYFNSSNLIVGRLFELRSSLINYFLLKDINDNILIENTLLKENILELKNASSSTQNQAYPEFVPNDNFEIISAKVINNSVFKKNNNFTLDKGSNDNVKVGQGVLGPYGIVGKIHSVSKNFSVGHSLLNSKLMISSFVGKSKIISTSSWLGNNPETLNLLYVPKHFKVLIGDTVFTSSFNSTFPQGVPISVIKEVDINTNSNFLEIKSTPIENFYSLFNVYIVNYKLKDEKQSLELN